MGVWMRRGVGVWVWVCVFGDGGVGCVCVCVCQLEPQRPRFRCEGRSCDGGRRAALDVADDIEVRVRLAGVVGVWVWLCE